jgi:hypothetical protein
VVVKYVICGMNFYNNSIVTIVQLFNKSGFNTANYI